MPNYKNGMIYKLCCKDHTIKDVYVGSTTNFTRRKHKHKHCCNNEKGEKYNYKVYRFIRENGGWDNWDMVLVENVVCESKLDLEKIERQYLEKLEATLNSRIPNRSKKEYHEKNKEKRKEYREKNKEKIKKQTKEYREKNKEKRNKYSKEYREKNKEYYKEYNKEYNKE